MATGLLSLRYLTFHPVAFASGNPGDAKKPENDPM
jgi:hypothetical protein